MEVAGYKLGLAGWLARGRGRGSRAAGYRRAAKFFGCFLVFWAHSKIYTAQTRRLFSLSIPLSLALTATTRCLCLACTHSLWKIMSTSSVDFPFCLLSF